MDKVQKIRAEIERLKSLIGNNAFLSDYEKGCNFGREDMCEELISFIDSLQEETVSDDLEEVAEYLSKTYAGEGSVDPKREAFAFYIGFKNGAKWQKAKDQSTIELAEDHAMLAGMEKMKEQMMAKAFDAEVLENYDGKCIEYDETILDEKLSDCNVFDKVKVLVIKEG